MNRLSRGILLAVCVLLVGFGSPAPGSHIKADYVEACSCHLFCPCYFNKMAEHPYCEFNMAVTIREGKSGAVDLTGSKYWITGDLGDEWGTKRKGKWVVVSFDPKTAQAQRDALVPLILKTYGLEWGELKAQEAPITITRSGDTVEASLAGGKMAHMKLKREPGVDGKGVTLQNVKYFDAQRNSGFAMYKSLDHSANVMGHKFQYADRNAFLISIEREQPVEPAKK
ncbi:MAG: DUF1326 domain-containing protein [Acidobacteriales bacterium]|nr:DUF1326 domain-containing protein [Terriglobales bacterium]